MNGLETDCIQCGKPAHGNWFCREHYLLKEATYGIHDLETRNEGFEAWGIRRIREYVDYMNAKDVIHA